MIVCFVDCIIQSTKIQSYDNNKAPSNKTQNIKEPKIRKKDNTCHDNNDNNKMKNNHYR